MMTEEEMRALIRSEIRSMFEDGALELRSELKYNYMFPPTVELSVVYKEGHQDPVELTSCDIEVDEIVDWVANNRE